MLNMFLQPKMNLIQCGMKENYYKEQNLIMNTMAFLRIL